MQPQAGAFPRYAPNDIGFVSCRRRCFRGWNIAACTVFALHKKRAVSEKGGFFCSVRFGKLGLICYNYEGIF